jgi:hypothetical protein
MLSRRVLQLVLSGAIAASACGRSAAPVDGGSVPNKSAGSAAADPEVETSLELLDPGAEPRSELRLRLEPGRSLVREVRWETRDETSGPGIDHESRGQLGSRESIQMRGRSGSGAVTVTVVSRLESFDPGEGSRAIEKVRGGSGAMEVRATHPATQGGVIPRGRAPRPEIAGYVLGAEAVAANEQYLVPLPRDAVGEGARWRYRVDIRRDIITARIDWTYKLLRHESDRVVLLRSATGESVLHIGGAPTTAETEVPPGELVIDLTSPVTTSESLTERTTLRGNVMGMDMATHEEQRLVVTLVDAEPFD